MCHVKLRQLVDWHHSLNQEFATIQTKTMSHRNWRSAYTRRCAFVVLLRRSACMFLTITCNATLSIFWDRAHAWRCLHWFCMIYLVFKKRIICHHIWPQILWTTFTIFPERAACMFQACLYIALSPIVWDYNAAVTMRHLFSMNFKWLNLPNFGTWSPLCFICSFWLLPKSTIRMIMFTNDP